MPLTPKPPDALFRAENRLFQLWQRRQPTLLRDGALGGPESTYSNAPIRVLFLLKEPNDSGGRWSGAGADLRLQTAAFAELRSTFPVLLLLAACAQSPAGSLSFADARKRLRDPEARRELLRSVALVNVKKTPGGAVCNDRSLHAAVAADADLLRRQLSFYRPHLTIAGGSTVFALLAGLRRQAVSPGRSLEHRPYFTDPQLGLCLSFFHPQATKGFAYLFDLLRDSLEAHALPATLPRSLG